MKIWWQQNFEVNTGVSYNIYQGEDEIVIQKNEENKDCTSKKIKIPILTKVIPVY